jgi:HD-like signal output (HDOD) protein/DNA-binding CsgD family transcriptional regulator
VATIAPQAAGPTDPYASRERRHNEGQGRRLTSAFEALEAFPALEESRNRVRRMFETGEPSAADLVQTIEGDVALSLTALRLANQVEGSSKGRVDSAVAAVEVLTPAALLSAADHARTYEFFEQTPIWHSEPERFRVHGLATQRAAERVADEIDYQERNRLMVAALVHDLGKLVLVHAYAGYPREVHGDARTPEERLQRERLELGVDHALVGGVICRRWGLPGTFAQAIESHHAKDAEGEAAIIRLADMLAHHLLGGTIAASELISAGRSLALEPDQLREIMYDLPRGSGTSRPRQVDPCPLSKRELEVLKRLAKGMVYKQIGTELELSTSTVRTHLHNIYGKLGAMDRAQAVLIATDRGWI